MNSTIKIGLGASALLMLPASATARELVLSPPIILSGDAVTALNITSLLSSELEFTEEVDAVVQLEERPGMLNSACLLQRSCLSGLAQDFNADLFVVSTLSRGPDGYTLELILYDSAVGAVQQRQSFDLPKESEAMADGMTDVVRVLFHGDEKHDVLVDSGVFELEEQEEQWDSEFGDGTSSAPVTGPPAMDLGELMEEFDELETELASSPVQVEAIDLQGPTTISGRLGYSQYYDLDFITVGVELAIPITPRIAGTASAQIFNAPRVVPDELQADLGAERVWDSMVPFTLGGEYRILTTSPLDYRVGADAILASYVIGEKERAVSAGLRGRAGARYELNDMFALDLDVSLGVWHGKDWVLVGDGVKNTGFIPQVSTGMVFAL